MNYTRGPWTISIDKNPVISCGATLKPLASMTPNDRIAVSNILANAQVTGERGADLAFLQGADVGR